MDVDDASDAMAAAMGFSSFGAQKANKRRKFNPTADAVVASSATIPLHPTTTGSNTTPLGHRPQNHDEVDLDEDGEDGTAPGVAPEPGVSGSKHDDLEPQYLDAAPSVMPDPANSLQSRTVTALGSSTAPNLPPKPPPSLNSGGPPSHGGTRGHRQDRVQHRQQGAKWWENYYDPAFIVNPWEKLETSMGFEPLGQWVSWEEAKTART
ncbi:hypothetical protein F5Y18DRAFT_99357 [Xylariaceae sp. FL1019]|nr:hypothetical protein F5Y18DRAFT_99357 [Xylariaceae sp. FL1019]